MGSMGYIQAGKYYDKIHNTYGDVIEHISDIADKWMSTRNEKHLEGIDMPSEKAGQFLAR